MNIDRKRVCKIITPQGLIVTMQESDFPKVVRDHYKNFDLIAPDESATQTMVGLTGCRCTIETQTFTTASPEDLEQ